jgi:DNA-binding CsgD family transcriptional regulator
MVKVSKRKMSEIPRGVTDHLIAVVPSILSALREHKPLDAIASEHRCSTEDITRLLTTKQAGVSEIKRRDLVFLRLAQIGQRHEELLALLGSGLTYGEIGERFKQPVNLISRYILRYDLPARSRGFPRGRARERDLGVIKERAAKALALREKGFSLGQIAEQLGFTSRERARQILLQAGARSSREAIAADRLLIAKAIAPHVAKGLSVAKICALLQGQSIKVSTADVTDTLRAAQSHRYESMAEAMKDTDAPAWENLSDIKLAMALLRDAVTKRTEVQHRETSLRPQRKKLLSSALLALDTAAREKIAARADIGEEDLYALCYGRRTPTYEQWSRLLPLMPALAAIPYPK